MKRYTIIAASLLAGAVIGSSASIVVVHSASIDDVQAQALPKPAKCFSVTVRDLITDPRYTNDTALVGALSILPDDLPFFRCRE